MVIFFDIDGTIVDEKTQIIPQSTLRAVERLRENGHIPVVNTGRPYSHIDPRVRSMAFAGWVCSCGMDVRLGDRRIFLADPDRDMMRRTAERIARCGMQPIYECHGGVIMTDSRQGYHARIYTERERMKAKGFTVLDAAEQAEITFQKLVTLDSPGCRRAQFLKEMAADYEITIRDGDMVEFVTKGCSKAAGMEHLMAALECARSDTLAIGDSTNDLPMFRYAAHTACLGDGMDELKAVSEYITDTVLNDGIEKALRHFDLL